MRFRASSRNNLVHRAFSFSDGLVGLGHEGVGFHRVIRIIQSKIGSINSVLNRSDKADEPGLVESLSVEKEKLRECLIQAKGNLSRAAEMANMSRQAFNYQAGT